MNWKNLLQSLPFFAAVVPKNVGRLAIKDGAPKGLSLLHIADSAPEAELLSQVLNQAGFHVEFVPSIAGAFGITGSSRIYIPDAELEAAGQFLREYLDAPLETL